MHVRAISIPESIAPNILAANIKSKPFVGTSTHHATLTLRSIQPEA